MRSASSMRFDTWPIAAVAAVAASYLVFGAVGFIRTMGLVMLLRALNAAWTRRLPFGGGREPSLYLGIYGSLVYAGVLAAAGVAVILAAPVVTCVFLPHETVCP